jgi:hypothetical protein
MNSENTLNMNRSDCNLNFGVDFEDCFDCEIQQPRPLRREAPRDYGMPDPYFEQEVLEWFSTMTPDKAMMHLNRITRVIVNNMNYNIENERRMANRSSSSSSSDSIVNSDGRLGSLSREYIAEEVPLIRQETLFLSETENKENIHPNITVRVPQVQMDVDELNDTEMDISELT